MSTDAVHRHPCQRAAGEARRIGSATKPWWRASGIHHAAESLRSMPRRHPAAVRRSARAGPAWRSDTSSMPALLPIRSGGPQVATASPGAPQEGLARSLRRAWPGCAAPDVSETAPKLPRPVRPPHSASRDCRSLSAPITIRLRMAARLRLGVEGSWSVIISPTEPRSHPGNDPCPRKIATCRSGRSIPDTLPRSPPRAPVWPAAPRQRHQRRQITITSRTFSCRRPGARRVEGPLFSSRLGLC